MSDSRGTRYTLEQRAFLVEHYFRTNSYTVTQGRFQKNPKNEPSAVEFFNYHNNALQNVFFNAEFRY